MNINKRIISVIAAASVAAIALTGCSPSDAAVSYDERVKSQKATQMDGTGQEAVNLQEKTERENDPEAIRYLYVMNFGQIVGYYVTKGKISSNGSQQGPETELVTPYQFDYYAVDSAQDDGSYGAGDPGIFFFTAEGVMVVTSLDYIQSDAPLNIDTPRLVE